LPNIKSKKAFEKQKVKEEIQNLARELEKRKQNESKNQEPVKSQDTSMMADIIKKPINKSIKKSFTQFVIHIKVRKPDEEPKFTEPDSVTPSPRVFPVFYI